MLFSWEMFFFLYFMFSLLILNLTDTILTCSWAGFWGGWFWSKPLYFRHEGHGTFRIYFDDNGMFMRVCCHCRISDTLSQLIIPRSRSNFFTILHSSRGSGAKRRISIFILIFDSSNMIGSRSNSNFPFFTISELSFALTNKCHIIIS